MGEPGTEMYIIISGEARFEHGHQWESCDPFEVEEARAKNRERKRKLKSGDSFGEEIILGLEENYHYTVVSITSMSKYAISVASFTQAFRHMPMSFIRCMRILRRMPVQMLGRREEKAAPALVKGALVLHSVMLSSTPFKTLRKHVQSWIVRSRLWKEPLWSIIATSPMYW